MFKYVAGTEKTMSEPDDHIKRQGDGVQITACNEF